MRISTRGIYALEIVVDLAMHSEDGHLESLKNIAMRRSLSEKYLERIVKKLKERGIIVSVRGAHGGYTLAREDSQITVREVLEATEGELAPVACLTKDAGCGMAGGECPTRELWDRIWKGMQKVTEEVSIRDIIDKMKELQEAGGAIKQK